MLAAHRHALSRSLHKRMRQIVETLDDAVLILYKIDEGESRRTVALGLRRYTPASGPVRI